MAPGHCRNGSFTWRRRPTSPWILHFLDRYFRSFVLVGSHVRSPSVAEASGGANRNFDNICDPCMKSNRSLKRDAHSECAKHRSWCASLFFWRCSRSACHALGRRYHRGGHMELRHMTIADQPSQAAPTIQKLSIGGAEARSSQCSSPRPSRGHDSRCCIGASVGC